MTSEIMRAGPFYPVGNVGSWLGSFSFLPHLFIQFKIFIKKIQTPFEPEAPWNLRPRPNAPHTPWYSKLTSSSTIFLDNMTVASSLRNY
jgi:hypothetical protein